jgi:hypothetical protein
MWSTTGILSATTSIASSTVRIASTQPFSSQVQPGGNVIRLVNRPSTPSNSRGM